MLYAIFRVTALNSRKSLKPLLNQVYQCPMLLNSADSGDDRKIRLKSLPMWGKYLRGLSSWKILFSGLTLLSRAPTKKKSSAGLRKFFSHCWRPYMRIQFYENLLRKRWTKNQASLCSLIANIYILKRTPFTLWDKYPTSSKPKQPASWEHS